MSSEQSDHIEEENKGKEDDAIGMHINFKSSSIKEPNSTNVSTVSKLSSSKNPKLQYLRNKALQGTLSLQILEKLILSDLPKLKSSSENESLKKHID